MKLRTLVVATSAALFSLGAVAAGDKQSQSQSGSQEQGAQSQSQVPQSSSSGASAGGSSAGQSATGQQSSSAGAGATQQSQESAMSPEVIKKVQKALNDKGYDAGPVDGQWGPLTQRAVQNFQQSQGQQQASGELNKQTLTALGVEGAASAATGGSSGEQQQSGTQSGAGSTQEQKSEQGMEKSKK